MAAAYQVPDIAERLVLIDFWNDPIPWHMRLLLQGTGAPGVWIASSPDMEVARVDLNEHRVVLLQGGSPIPPDYAGNYSYCFDSPIDAVELARVRAEGREMVTLLGLSTATATPDGSTWRVADPADDSFGDAVPAEALGTPAVFRPEGSAALLRIEENWTFAQLVPDAELSEWRRKKTAHQDPRLLGHFTAQGSEKRFLTFDAAAQKLDYAALAPPGWPFKGDRISLETVQSLVSVGRNFVAEDLEWQSKSGVHRSSGTSVAHRRVAEAMMLFTEFDQLDITQIAGVEYLLRWWHQMEVAVRRSPSCPDYSGLDNMMPSQLDGHGGLALNGFTHWFAGIQRDEAQVLKQQRLMKEEQAHMLKAGSPAPALDGGGSAEERKARKNAAKAAKAAAKAGAAAGRQP